MEISLLGIPFVPRLCLHCSEPIMPWEMLPVAQGKFHRECLIRSISGSLAHQQQKCLCFGGTGEDDPNLSIRENARAAARYSDEKLRKNSRAKFN